MKRILFLLVGILVSVVSLYFAFQGFDLGALWEAMGRVQLPYFLLLIVPYILTFMTKVWRWRTMFHPDEITGTFYRRIWSAAAAKSPKNSQPNTRA